MKKQISLILTFIFVLSVAAISFASEEKNTQSHSFRLMKAAESLQITGTAKAINAEAGIVTVSKKFKDKTIEVTAGVDNQTKIMKGEEKKSLQDINPGDRIILVYTGEDGKNKAKSISIQ